MFNGTPHLTLWSQGCCQPSSAAVSLTTQHTVLVLRVKPPDIKNDTQKDACCFSTVACACQNGVFCFFLGVSHAPFAHLPTCSAAPQSPLVDRGSTATRVPQTPSLSFGRMQKPSSNGGPLFLSQLTFLSSSEMALEGQIRAGLRKKKKKRKRNPYYLWTCKYPIIRHSYLQSHRLLSLCQRPNERARSANEVLLNHLFFAFLDATQPVEPPWSRAASSPVWIRVIHRLLMIWFFYFPPWCPSTDHTHLQMCRRLQNVPVIRRGL